jgi:hypothetical protein
MFCMYYNQRSHTRKNIDIHGFYGKFNSRYNASLCYGYGRDQHEFEFILLHYNSERNANTAYFLWNSSPHAKSAYKLFN